MNVKLKIGLGTVQFGLSYGISNIYGQTSPDEISRILDAARKEDLLVVDTASAYGTSEEQLGKNDLTNFRVVSKFLSIENKGNSRCQLLRSLDLLGLEKLYGYLAHRPKDVLSQPSQWGELNGLKKDGLVEKIGFSFNDPEELSDVLARGWVPDLVQVPFNYLDDRFRISCEKLRGMGCEIHSRSALLQGLFFKPTDELSPFFDAIKPMLSELHKKGDKLPGLLLKYCLVQDFIDVVIVGVNNTEQLVSNLRMVEVDQVLPPLSCKIPNEILSPSGWPQT